MKTRVHVSETPATRLLRERGVRFSEHPYDYVLHGGTESSSAALGVAEYEVVKTLIMEDENRRPLIILMHGNLRVSTRALARQIGCKRVEPCAPATAERHSGYQVGGTSPFATRRAMPVYVEASVLALSRIYINGGRRGYLIRLDPSCLSELLGAQPVECAQAN